MQTITPRILCVDDDADNREMIETMLRFSDADFEFAAAATPEEGLRLAAAQRFDLYLLDYRFARMTGAEVCRALRQTNPDTPILFFTCEAHEQERQAAMEAGADAYLVKPDDLRQLTATVKQLLSARRPPATRGAPPTTHRSRVSV
jgi:CheY-like chemotaxis protein